jgi:flavodoxin
MDHVQAEVDPEYVNEGELRMNALIVYDSVFGNTEQVAREIGKGLEAGGSVQILRVTEVRMDQLSGLELLAVGSPTRGFRPTEGITAFLKGLPEGGLNGMKVAAFDTRIAPEDIKPRILGFLVKIGGYAAPSIAGRLAKAGGRLAAPPEGFAVSGTEGPLKEGELERAADWGRLCGGIQ